MALMGYREYGRHRGVSLTAVQKAIADGRISVVTDAKGKSKVDSDAADLAWLRNTDPAKQSVLHSAGPVAMPVAAPAPAAGVPGVADPDDPDDLPADAASSEYRQARTLREQIRSKREQIHSMNE